MMEILHHCGRVSVPIRGSFNLTTQVIDFDSPPNLSDVSVPIRGSFNLTKAQNQMLMRIMQEKGVSVPIRGSFNLTSINRISDLDRVGFRPHQGII